MKTQNQLEEPLSLAMKRMDADNAAPYHVPLHFGPRQTSLRHKPFRSGMSLILLHQHLVRHIAGLSPRAAPGRNGKLTEQETRYR